MAPATAAEKIIQFMFDNSMYSIVSGSLKSSQFSSFAVRVSFSVITWAFKMVYFTPSIVLSVTYTSSMVTSQNELYLTYAVKSCYVQQRHWLSLRLIIIISLSIQGHLRVCQFPPPRQHSWVNSAPEDLGNTKSRSPHVFHWRQVAEF
jgi:hypothetical protein